MCAFLFLSDLICFPSIRNVSLVSISMKLILKNEWKKCQWNRWTVSMMAISNILCFIFSSFKKYQNGSRIVYASSIRFIFFSCFLPFFLSPFLLSFKIFRLFARIVVVVAFFLSVFTSESICWAHERRRKNKNA